MLLHSHLKFLDVSLKGLHFALAFPQLQVQVYVRLEELLYLLPRWHYVGIGLMLTLRQRDIVFKFVVQNVS